MSEQNPNLQADDNSAKLHTVTLSAMNDPTRNDG